MLFDAQLSFVPIGGNLSLVAGAGVDIPTNPIDLLGQGVGTVPQNIIGTASLFGTDIGIGGRARPELNITIGTGLVTSNSCTLTVQLQAAPDTAGTHQPGTWQTIVESGAITAAQGLANTVIARFPFPPEFPNNEKPRYMRLNFHVLAAANFTAGTIASALVTIVRDDQGNKFAYSNFTVA